MRGIAKKALWGFGAAALLLLLLAAAATFYLARNPDRVKDLLTATASRATGVEVRIQRLNWTLHPLRIQAEGITASSPKDSSTDLRAFLGNVGADLALVGGFGDRVLVVQRISARDVDISLGGALPLSRKKEGPAASSRFVRAVVGLLRYLLIQDVRLERAELVQGRVGVQVDQGSLEVRGIEAQYTPESGIGVSCGLHVNHPGSGLDMDLAEIRMEMPRPSATGPVPWRVSSGTGILAREDLRVTGLAFEAAGTMDPGGEIVHMESLVLDLPDARPLVPVSLNVPLEIRIRASGRVSPDKGRLHVLDVQATLRAADAEIRATSRISGSWIPSIQGAMESLSCRFRPGEWLSVLPKDLRARLEGVRLSGDVSLSGGMTVAVEEDVLRVRPDLALHLNDNVVAVHTPSLQARGRISGTLQGRGSLPDPSISGTIRADGVILEAGALQIPSASAGLSLEGGVTAIRVHHMELRAPEVRVGPSDRAFSLRDLLVRFQEARIDTAGPGLACPDALMVAEGLGPFHLGVQSLGQTAVLSVRGEKTGMLSLLSREGFPLSGWGLQGEESVDIQVERRGQGTWALKSRFVVVGLALDNAELGLFGEGVGLSLKAEGTMSGDPDSRILGTAALKAEAGEVLLDRFYLNMGNHSVSLNTEFTWDPGHETVHIPRMETALSGLLSMRASGTLEHLPGGMRALVSVSVPPFDLAPVFRLFAVEPFKMAVPLLERLAVSGTASADLSLDTGPDGSALLGDVHVRQGTISAEGPAWALRDMDLSMPVWYRTVPDPGPIPPPKEGRLLIRSVELPVLPTQPFSIAFGAQPNRLRVPGPTVLQIPGGDLGIDGLELEHDPEEGLRAKASVTVGPVELQPWLSKVWPDPPQGVLTGTLPGIVYRNGTVSSREALKAEIFGGRLILDNFGATGLFSSAPVFGLDARWEDLDLESMTRGTEFGRVTGVLKGHLKGLELAFGQPQSFDLLLETVPRKGVSQRISVTAVDNIARIGGGGSPFMGMAGMFTSLFREFPYEQIGVHAVLENDVFRINGTIQEGGTEYLVKRSGFSGVNVVNQNPDNRIRFKDMVKRIQRINASRGGPVIQ